MQYDTDR